MKCHEITIGNGCIMMWYVIRDAYIKHANNLCKYMHIYVNYANEWCEQFEWKYISIHEPMILLNVNFEWN